MTELNFSATDWTQMHTDKLKYTELTQLIIKREAKGERLRAGVLRLRSFSPLVLCLSPYLFNPC